MKKIFKSILSPLSLILTKGEEFNMKSALEMKLCKGSTKLKNKEMAVIQHYKPIVKI
jgi:hypothetical protein